MKVWSTIQGSKRYADELKLDDHDVSFLRSWKVFIRLIIESFRGDF